MGEYAKKKAAAATTTTTETRPAVTGDFNPFLDTSRPLAPPADMGPDNKIPFDEIKPFISSKESANNPTAVNATANENGTWDSGLYQINDVHLSDDGSPLYTKIDLVFQNVANLPPNASVEEKRKALLDPQVNEKIARTIYKLKGIGAWSTKDKVLAAYNASKMAQPAASTPQGATTVPPTVTQQQVAPAVTAGQRATPYGPKAPPPPAGAAGTFAERWMASLGNREQQRNMLLQIYGPNIHLTANGEWYVKPPGEPKFRKFNPDIDLAALGGQVAPVGLSMVGTAIAAPGGPGAMAVGSGLGMAAGEALNMAAADYFLGPSGETIPEQAAGVGEAFLVGAGSEIGGQYLAKGVKSVTDRLRPFAKDFDKRMSTLATRYGITAHPSELSHSPAVEGIDELLRNAIGSAGVYKAAEAPRLEQTRRIIMDEIRKIGTPASNYKDFAHAAMGAVEQLRARALGYTDPTTLTFHPGIAQRLMEKVYDTMVKKFPTTPYMLPNGQIGAMPLINLRPVKQEIAALSDGLAASNPNRRLLEKVLGEGDITRMDAFMDLRSAVGELTRSKELIGERAQKLAVQTLNTLDKQFQNEALQYGSMESVQALNQFRKFYSATHKFFSEGILMELAKMRPTDIARAILTSRRPEDIKIIRTVLQREPGLWEKAVASTVDAAIHGTIPGMKSRGIYGIARTQSKSVPILRAEALDSWWKQMSPEMKKELFTPEQAKSLKDAVDFFTSVSVSRPPQAYIGRTVGISRATALSGRVAQTVPMLLGGAAGAAAGAGATETFDPLVTGMFSLGGLIFGPQILARMVLSPTGREILGEGFKLGRKGIASVKYPTKLAAYLSRPEFQEDMADAQRRLKAGMRLYTEGKGYGPNEIDKFLEEHPEFK